MPHLLHTLLPIFKNFWESIIEVYPQPHVYVQWVIFFRLDVSITMLNTGGCLLLLTHHLLSPSRDVYSGLTSGLVRHDQGGMRKVPCLGWAKWKLGRAPCPRGTRTWACGRRVSKPPPPPYTQSLQEWRSPPTSTWEFQRWGASWGLCANTQPLCRIVLEDSLVEVAYGTRVPPGEVPPHSSSLDCTKVYSLPQQKKHFMNCIFSFCKWN